MKKMKAGETRDYTLRVRCESESDGNCSGKFVARVISPKGKTIGKAKDWSGYIAAVKALAWAQLRRKL